MLERTLMEQHYGSDHPDVAKMLANIGNIYGYLGDHTQEKEMQERALKILEQHHCSDHPDLAKILANLGNAYSSLSDHSRAKEVPERALKILEQHYGLDHPDVANTLAKLAAAYVSLGDHSRAKELGARRVHSHARRMQSAVKIMEDGTLRHGRWVENGPLQKTASEDGNTSMLAEEVLDAKSFNERGWQRLVGDQIEGAVEDFDKAIELDPSYAAAYNNRGIVRELAGRDDFSLDYDEADRLTSETPEVQEKLRKARKWKQIGWKGRGEVEAMQKAQDADFLISFTTGDRTCNDELLRILKNEKVLFRGELRSVTFCTDKSLSIAHRVVCSQTASLRKDGEFPSWFKEYMEAALQTRHGVLILNMTEGYLKSKACRWEFGYIRRPELVNVLIPGEPCKIVPWEELAQNAELCQEVFNSKGFSEAMMSQDLKQEKAKTLEQMSKLAKLAKEQEFQAWCELPLRQVAYAFSKRHFEEEKEEESEKISESSFQLARVCLETGFTARAKELLEKLLGSHQTGNLGLDNPGLANLLTYLANAHGALGDDRQKKEMLERALKLLEQHCGSVDPEVAITLVNLGSAHESLGDYKMAKEMLGRALKIEEHHYGLDHPVVAKTLVNLGNIHGDLGDQRQKKEMLERALKILEQSYGSDHPEVAITLTNLGNADGCLGDHRRAKEMLERALKIKEQHYGSDHPEVAIVLVNLGAPYGQLGAHSQTKEILERALKILEQHYGSDHPDVAKTLTNLGSAHLKLGDHTRGKQMLERALKFQERYYGSDHPEVADTLDKLVAARLLLDDLDAAKEMLERSVKIEMELLSALIASPGQPFVFGPQAQASGAPSAAASAGPSTLTMDTGFQNMMVEMLRQQAQLMAQNQQLVATMLRKMDLEEERRERAEQAAAAAAEEAKRAAVAASAGSVALFWGANHELHVSRNWCRVSISVEHCGKRGHRRQLKNQRKAFDGKDGKGDGKGGKSGKDRKGKPSGKKGGGKNPDAKGAGKGGKPEKKDTRKKKKKGNGGKTRAMTGEPESERMADQEEQYQEEQWGPWAAAPGDVLGATAVAEVLMEATVGPVAAEALSYAVPKAPWIRYICGRGPIGFFGSTPSGRGESELQRLPMEPLEFRSNFTMRRPPPGAFQWIVFLGSCSGFDEEVPGSAVSITAGIFPAPLTSEAATLTEDIEKKQDDLKDLFDLVVVLTELGISLGQVMAELRGGRSHMAFADLVQMRLFVKALSEWDKMTPEQQDRIREEALSRLVLGMMRRGPLYGHIVNYGEKIKAFMVQAIHGTMKPALPIR
ncbi:nphp3 [Symbiodinium sp. KB8]|nr:nphp3 [Symbiodinium sp. KB8]